MKFRLSTIVVLVSIIAQTICPMEEDQSSIGKIEQLQKRQVEQYPGKDIQPGTLALLKMEHDDNDLCQFMTVLVRKNLSGDEYAIIFQANDQLRQSKGQIAQLKQLYRKKNTENDS